MSKNKLVKTVITPAVARRVASLKEKIKRSCQRVAKERDLLRSYISDIEAIADCCDDAVTDIEAGVDRLSEYL